MNEYLYVEENDNDNNEKEMNNKIQYESNIDLVEKENKPFMFSTSFLSADFKKKSKKFI